jgi:hypothetical protein
MPSFFGSGVSEYSLCILGKIVAPLAVW